MRFIGVLGILALLGLAWAMSYHKRDVKLRIVFWGLGMQFLFAVIILRQDFWSFVGMGVLATLLAVYQFRHDLADRRSIADLGGRDPRSVPVESVRSSVCSGPPAAGWAAVVGAGVAPGQFEVSRRTPRCRPCSGCCWSCQAWRG